MGISSGKSFHARNCHRQNCRDDPRSSQGKRDSKRTQVGYGLILATVAALSGTASWADALKLAYWNTELEAKGPGILAQSILRKNSPAVDRVLRAIEALDADVLVLGGFDYDAGGLALTALNQALAKPYPHLRPLRPNTGVPTGVDVDGNGRLGEAADAQGYGLFPGQGGLAILSRLPFSDDLGADYSSFLWKDLPGADLSALTDDAKAVLRLSATSHSDTVVTLRQGQNLHLLTWHGTTPAFDGPEDRNGKRNADETRFWTLLLDGALPYPPPPAPFVIIGQANADPEKGDGSPDAIRALLADPRLQSPLSGDTSDYGGTIGPLRTAYILPSADLAVTDAGMAAAPPGARHRLIWVDLRF